MARRLAAIIAADMVSYSRLMAADEEGTLARLQKLRRELIDPAIAEAGGEIVKLTGDGMLALFDSVVAAVEAGVAVQNALLTAEASEPADRRIAFRIGIHVGDILLDAGDIYGDAVNIAARLEGIAPACGIVLSEDAWRQVDGKVDVVFTDGGEQTLKNIPRPMRIYRIELAMEPAGTLPVPDLTPPDKPSIAVLPFQNMSGDPDQEFFADGMSEDIITALSKLRWFFVIARNSTFSYKGSSPDIRNVARELNVRYVLEGSVRLAGGRARITAQLIDGETGNHLWAERYDRQMTDIFAVQDDITESVVGAIGPQLQAAEIQRIQSKPPESLDAWGCVICSLWHLGRQTGEDTDEACRLLRQAIATSPGYAKAHSVLAFAESRRLFFGADFDTTVAAAREIARVSRELDDDDPWSHFASGYVECFTGRYDDAIAWYRRAIELNENFALAHGNVAAALALGGHPDEAIQAVERALRMSPRDPFNFSYLHFAGLAYFAAGRYAEAVAAEERALRERPNFATAMRCLAACHAALGQIDKAQAAIAEALRLAPGSTVQRDAYGQVAYAQAEDRKRYAEALQKAGLPEK
ncbi:tetratricopeptide repeat protein [Roseibium sp.]|uniref:tetratricopeptide repeat protein n=1 Tax=Roseibium sp. TaxID=1936156 RepID=UPI003D0C5930